MLAFLFYVFCSAIAVAAARSPWVPNPLLNFASAFVLFILVGTCWLCLLQQIKSRWYTRKQFKPYFVAWMALMVMAAIAATIAHALLPPHITSHYVPLTPTLITAAALGALGLRYFYIHASWQFHLNLGQTARSQALAARIRPHFLFNTLNTIAELTRVDAEAAEHAVEDLARLYRMNLANVQNQVPLADEINTAKSYLYIEQYRLGTRMQQVWDTGSLPLDAMIPVLTLQPLVENAVYHGIEPSPKGGTLTIKGWIQGNWLTISVTNTLPDTTRQSQHQGHNMATENIRQRLAVAFGGDATMIVNTDENEYKVTLRFPYVIG